MMTPNEPNADGARTQDQQTLARIRARLVDGYRLTEVGSTREALVLHFSDGEHRCVHALNRAATQAMLDSGLLDQLAASAKPDHRPLPA